MLKRIVIGARPLLVALTALFLIAGAVFAGNSMLGSAPGHPSAGANGGQLLSDDHSNGQADQQETESPDGSESLKSEAPDSEAGDGAEATDAPEATETEDHQGDEDSGGASGDADEQHDAAGEHAGATEKPEPTEGLDEHDGAGHDGSGGDGNGHDGSGDDGGPDGSGGGSDD